MLVGRLRDGRVPGLSAVMVVGGRGAPWCRQPDGRRSRFHPCTPGWCGVGRLACGLFAVKWRLQSRCSWCAVVLAASWSAWSAWFSSRCCRWSYRRMLFVQPARPCRRWLVASRLVQVRRSAVRQRSVAAFVMVGSRSAVVFVGMGMGMSTTHLVPPPLKARTRGPRTTQTGPERRQGPPAASSPPHRPSMSAHIQQMARYCRHCESQPNP